MRPCLFALLAIVIAAAGDGWVVRASQATPAAPGKPGAAPQTPTFRAGTDLMTVDVAVLERGGGPVEDLAAGDFNVRIDGKTRRIVALELVRPAADGTTTAAAPATRSHVTVTTNAGASGGRRILIAVDQTHIGPGAIKPLTNAAAQFVDRLTPGDQVAFTVFPESSIHVDFTSDKARVVAAMQGLIGRPQDSRKGTFNIGLVEARAITDRERQQLPELGSNETDRTPVMASIMERGCEADPSDLAGLRRCRERIVDESAQIVQTMITDLRRSTSALESLIGQLAQIDGPKSLVLISAGLAIDNELALDTLIRAAAASRTSLNVLLVEPEREEVVDAKPTNQAPREMEDRRLRAEGLEELAADGRGALYRVAGSGEGIFNSLALELTSSYVLGVESLPEDKAGTLRKLEVSVRRAGARVRTSHVSLRAPAPSRSMEDNLRDALSMRTALNGLPVRMTTFSQWDSGGDKVKVSLAAQLAAAAGDPSDAIVGYVLTDRDNRTIAGTTQKQRLLPIGRSGGPTRYGTTLLLDPGVYVVRMGVVDAEGRRGTVIREVNVQRSTSTEQAASDLFLGNPPASGQPLQPDVEPQITSGRIAAYLELYSAMPEDLDWTLVNVEIARDADAPALASEAAEVADGPRASWRVAAATVGLESLPPGSYVARARIVRDEKTVGLLSRPFILAAPNSAAK
jgi:VWFA-related protein